MMAAFIDLKKVYDIVDRETLLDCLEHLGLKYMLKNCAWREVTTRWEEELEEQPKLCVLKEPVSGDLK